MLNSQAYEALTHCRYKVAASGEELEAILRLRYKSYRAEGLIADNERLIMTDAFDETPNCVHVAIEVDGALVAAMRLHLLSELSLQSPTLEVFPEMLTDLRGGQTALDPTRFAIDPASRKSRVPLHFLALRIPFLAAMFYDVDLAFASLRTEHIPFYRRYLGYELVIPARRYPELTKPLHLLVAKFRDQRDTVLARTPIFGPVSEIPQANIAFPSLEGAYARSPKSRSAAA